MVGVGCAARASWTVLQPSREQAAQDEGPAPKADGERLDLVLMRKVHPRLRSRAFLGWPSYTAQLSATSPASVCLRCCRLRSPSPSAEHFPSSAQDQRTASHTLSCSRFGYPRPDPVQCTSRNGDLATPLPPRGAEPPLPPPARTPPTVSTGLVSTPAPSMSANR